MSISHDIISEFVKITNDKKEKPKEETVYATIVQTSDGKYVKIDGSDLVTPTETTTDIEEGERVTVLIKDHSAIITGNITSPSASANRVNGIVDVVSEKLGVFEHIVADKIDVNELNAYKATIEHLIVGKAEIEDLKATRAEIEFLDADVAHIKTLVNGNLTSDNILSFNITADKVTMADAFIKDAMVATINAAKINAGRINTNNVVIGSDDGGMLISGATQQFTDKNGKVRIQIGRDSTGDFTFVLYGEDGTGQIINQNGITASAVSDGLIVNDMINNNAAISGGKLDISSVIFEINNENDTAIHSSKIYLDEQNQSLEAAFNSLKTQVDTIVDVSIEGDLKAFTEQIQSNTAKIEMNRTGINTLASEDAIIRKEVSDLEGNLIETSNKLSSKYSSLEQNMDGFKLEVADVYAKKSTVKDLENDIATNYATTEVMNSAITQNATQIAMTVARDEIQNTKIGGTNLIGRTTQTQVYEVDIVEVIETGWTVRGWTNDRDNNVFRFLNVLDGNGWYTFSFDGKFGGSSFRTYVEANDERVGTVDLTSEWQHFSFTFEVTNYDFDNTGTYKFIEFQRLGNELYYFKNVQLEHGKIETDYSPCPRDYSTTTQMNSAITQKADEINLSVSQTINSIQTGGKNLIKNGNFEDGLNHWVYERFSGVTTTSLGIWEDGDWSMDGKKQCSFNTYDIKNDSQRQGEWTVRQSFKTVVGQEYTISYMIAGHRSYKTVAVRQAGDWAYLGSKDYGEILGGKNANNWVYDSITFTATTSETMIWFIMRETMSGDNAYMWFTDVCCVEGNKAQRFIPSFEEYSTTTQMNSAITQKADEINLTVNKIKRGARVARWVRCYMYGNTWNSGNHIVQVQVWSNGTNLALGKIPYSNGVLDNPDRMTDGNLDTNSYAELHPNGGDVYWEIDLGDEYPIDDITLWNYYGDSRKYHYILVTYDHNWEDLGVYNTWAGGTYVETSSGKNFVLNSSTVNNNLAQIDIKADSIKLKVDAVDSDLKNNYPTTTQMNSAITQKANEITSNVNMTAIAGVELMPQSHKRNSTSGYHVIGGNGRLYVNQWGLYVAGQAWVSSDFIAIDPGLPLKYYFFMENTSGYNPLTCLGFEQYNWNKEEIGVNASTIYVIQEKFTGYKSVGGTLPEGSFNSNTRYIKLRWLTNWDNSVFDVTYLMDCSVKQLGSINSSTQIAQMADSITSTVSSVNNLGSRMSTAESTITQHANQIATKVDVNGVKSTIQQNPESVRIGFNNISNYFDLTSARLKVGHTDGSYTEIGQNGVMYYANGSGNRYHCLMKQGWLGQISGTSWSRTITLPSEFKGKTFSIIVSVTEVNAVNTHDVIKHFKVTVPHNSVNYTNGTFVINMSALAYYVPGQQSASAIQTDISWIAIA